MVALGLVMVACPPRETIIEISATGVATFLETCNGGAQKLYKAELDCRALVQPCRDASCDALDCDRLEALCDGIELLTLSAADCQAFHDDCKQQIAACPSIQVDPCNSIVQSCINVVKSYPEVCGVPNLVTPQPPAEGGELTLGVQLFLIRELGDLPLATSGCGVATVSADDPAGGMNEAVAQALGDAGLEDESVTDPEQGLPLMLLFHDRDGDGITCERRELFACTILGRRSTRDETYDVLCGSCQKGLRPQLAVAPCDRDCMLPYCAELLGE